MIDYSELKMNIQKLNDRVYSYMNARNVIAAQKRVRRSDRPHQQLQAQWLGRLSFVRRPP